jgi:hypothetical protein
MLGVAMGGVWSSEQEGLGVRPGVIRGPIDTERVYRHNQPLARSSWPAKRT